MRSRYAAYAVGDADHLFRTWHPRTRPDDLTPDSSITWTGLRILEAREDADTAIVAFEAAYRTPSGPGTLRERSRFERRGGRWVYVDGVVS